MEKYPIALKVSDLDNVATIFADGICSGATVQVHDRGGAGDLLAVRDDIPYGHKIALCNIAAGADIIMLDNMTNEDMKKCVEITAGRALLEASGNMDRRNLREVADTGVDIISIGALTHTVKAADISLKFKLNS